MGTSGGPVAYSGPMTSSTIALIYAAALHLLALVAMVVLVVVGKVSWAEGGPIIAYLVGFGAGVPVTVGVTSSRGTSPPTP